MAWEAAAVSFSIGPGSALVETALSVRPGYSRPEDTDTRVSALAAELQSLPCNIFSKQFSQLYGCPLHSSIAGRTSGAHTGVVAYVVTPAILIGLAGITASIFVQYRKRKWPFSGSSSWWKLAGGKRQEGIARSNPGTGPGSDQMIPAADCEGLAGNNPTSTDALISGSPSNGDSLADPDSISIDRIESPEPQLPEMGTDAADGRPDFSLLPLAPADSVPNPTTLERIAIYDEARIGRAVPDHKTAWVGGGTYGDVYRGYDRINSAVAIKILKPGKVSQKVFLAEVNLIECFRFSNVVDFRGYCNAPKTKAIVMEWMHGGSFHKCLRENNMIMDDNTLKPLSWSRRLGVMLNVANGLKSMHAAGYVHCDIKPGDATRSRRARGPGLPPPPLPSRYC